MRKLRSVFECSSAHCAPMIATETSSAADLFPRLMGSRSRWLWVSTPAGFHRSSPRSPDRSGSGRCHGLTTRPTVRHEGPFPVAPSRGASAPPTALERSRAAERGGPRCGCGTVSRRHFLRSAPWSSMAGQGAKWLGSPTVFSIAVCRRPRVDVLTVIGRGLYEWARGRAFMHRLVDRRLEARAGAACRTRPHVPRSTRRSRRRSVIH